MRGVTVFSGGTHREPAVEVCPHLGVPLSPVRISRFAAGALRRLSAQPDVLEIVRTNTVPVPSEDHTSERRILSIAPALAEAVRRIHNGDPVSATFDPPAV